MKNYSETDLTESDDIENCTIASKTSEKKLGDIVKLTIGTDTTSEWYVLEDNSTTGTVRLLKATNIDNEKYAFDEVGNRTLENSSLCQYSPSNSGEECFLSIYSKYDGEKSVYLPGPQYTVTGTVGVDSTIKQNVDLYGANLSLGDKLIDIRLLSVEEYENINENAWAYATLYWMMNADDSEIYVDGTISNGEKEYVASLIYNKAAGIRPVITVSRDIIK